jgi:hypothetical protein
MEGIVRNLYSKTPKTYFKNFDARDLHMVETPDQLRLQMLTDPDVAEAAEIAEMDLVTWVEIAVRAAFPPEETLEQEDDQDAPGGVRPQEVMRPQMFERSVYSCLAPDRPLVSLGDPVRQPRSSAAVVRLSRLEVCKRG